jgi:hypothetical protein
VCMMFSVARKLSNRRAAHSFRRENFRYVTGTIDIHPLILAALSAAGSI